MYPNFKIVFPFGRWQIHKGTQGGFDLSHFLPPSPQHSMFYFSKEKRNKEEEAGSSPDGWHYKRTQVEENVQQYVSSTIRLLETSFCHIQTFSRVLLKYSGLALAVLLRMEGKIQLTPGPKTSRTSQGQVTDEESMQRDGTRWGIVSFQGSSGEGWWKRVI